MWLLSCDPFLGGPRASNWIEIKPRSAGICFLQVPLPIVVGRSLDRWNGLRAGVCSRSGSTGIQFVAGRVLDRRNMVGADDQSALLRAYTLQF